MSERTDLSCSRGGVEWGWGKGGKVHFLCLPSIFIFSSLLFLIFVFFAFFKGRFWELIGHPVIGGDIP
jgi:hypothetical protein